MLRADFFYKFFKYKENSSNQIMKYSSAQEFDLEKKINHKLIDIDKEITESSKALIEAQIVKLRANVSKSTNVIERIGGDFYRTKLEDSINWHQTQIKELYIHRRELQISLEKLKGIFWLNRIKRFLKILLITFFTLLILFIFLSGFMIILYLMPLIILISLGYLVITKKY
tara:strand:+ start:422 stop:934 length:513 start_codon:yes stop_codon:yes gene_type:complete